MTSLSTFTDEKSGTSPLAIRASFGAHEEATREASKPRYVRRNVASAYLLERYGFGAKKWLDKLATTGGGPAFHKAGRLAIYDIAELDRWATSKIGRAKTSTSDVQEAA